MKTYELGCHFRGYSGPGFGELLYRFPNRLDKFPEGHIVCFVLKRPMTTREVMAKKINLKSCHPNFLDCNKMFDILAEKQFTFDFLQIEKISNKFRNGDGGLFFAERLLIITARYSENYKVITCLPLDLDVPLKTGTCFYFRN